MKAKFILLILICSLYINNSKAQVDINDSLALVDLYNNTKGPSWLHKTGWLTAPVQQWYGITVENSRVTQIKLGENGLWGTLPESIGNLYELKELNFHLSDLTGELPSSIGNLTNLITLDISDCQFTGEIPQSLGNLSKAIKVDLSGCNLTGSIPESIGNLSSAVTLDFGSNKLSGKLPVGLFRTPALLYLDLDYNEFTSFPDIIEKGSKVEQLLINHNKFTHVIPEDIGNLSNLTYLGISFNEFESPIPEKLSKLNSLSSVNFSNNKFTGTIPEFLGMMPKLSSIDISYNQFEGAIPDSFGNKLNIRYLRLNNNRLSGRISEILGANPFTIFYFFNNEFLGPIPPTLKPFSYADIRFNNNQFTFDGLENLILNCNGCILVYDPQAYIPLHRHDNILAVTVGGTLGNNTYHWYKDGTLLIDIAGDSTLDSTLYGDGLYGVKISNTVADKLILQTDNPIVFPLSLIKFNAVLQNHNTILTWQTSSEINTSYFNIQRSINGKDFTNIGRINAKGNSSAVVNYEFADMNVFSVNSSKIFYRLQMVDANGKSDYSNIISINIPLPQTSISIVPNPTKDILNISFTNYSGKTHISIYDINGKKLIAATADIISGNTTTLNIASLKPGVYLLVADVNGQVVKEKFVKE